MANGGNGLAKNGRWIGKETGVSIALALVLLTAVAAGTKSLTTLEKDLEHLASQRSSDLERWREKLVEAKAEADAASAKATEVERRFGEWKAQLIQARDECQRESYRAISRADEAMRDTAALEKALRMTGKLKGE